MNSCDQEVVHGEADPRVMVPEPPLERSDFLEFPSY